MSVKLEIKKPCHEDWDAMTPQERGRFCASCSKTVYDVTTWSDTEVMHTFEDLNEQMCLRIQSDRIKRPEVNLFRSYVMVVVTILASFWFMLKTTVSKAQTKLPDVFKNKLDSSQNTVQQMRLSGTIYDTVYESSPVPYATVVARKNGKILKGTMADSSGNFSLIFNDLSSSEEVVITIDAIGFKAQQHAVKAATSVHLDAFLNDTTAIHNKAAHVRIDCYKVVPLERSVIMGIPARHFALPHPVVLPRLKILNQTDNIKSYRSDEIERLNLGR